MSFATVLLLGFGLGVRHATDADHVVAVTAMLQREPGARRALRLAWLWGLGHAAALLVVGSLIVLAGVTLPPAFELATGMLVAAMLVGLGAWHLVAMRARAGAPEATPGRRGAAARPLLVGIVHGLAGSAGVALLAATTIDSRPLAAAYLALVGAGTILGMVALTLVLAHPLRWSLRRGGWLHRAFVVGAAVASIGLGVAIGVEAIAAGAAA